MFKQEDYILTTGDLIPTDSFIITTGSQEYDVMEDINSINPSLLALSPPVQQEETMDVAAKFETVEFPVSPRGPPERTVFAGTLDFQVEINASDTHKRKYLFSNILNRIYVDMRTNFSIQFRWEWSHAPRPMFVRATAVFSDEAQAEKRVDRCTQHTHEASNAGLNPAIVKNVLHSAREMGTHGVYYCGRPELADSWYSVLVEFPGVTTGVPCSHAYQFVCKNSCPNGINRRAIDILFTLEDSFGNVFGRRRVGARVCACPRRDLVRDEKVEGGAKKGKRRVQPSKPATAKKIKVEVAREEARQEPDEAVLTLPPLQVIGVRAMRAGLEMMLAMMEQASSLRRSDPQAVQEYSKSIAGFRSQIDELKDEEPPTQ